ncbi:hypothetical protein SBV1_2040009 [Verrucomicrobia bacterium]|nr:hypothetical protein SBV1_2040009 [Verrucomicrobiota bacterium]
MAVIFSGAKKQLTAYAAYALVNLISFHSSVSQLGWVPRAFG